MTRLSGSVTETRSLAEQVDARRRTVGVGPGAAERIDHLVTSPDEFLAITSVRPEAEVTVVHECRRRWAAPGPRRRACRRTRSTSPRPRSTRPSAAPELLNV